VSPIKFNGRLLLEIDNSGNKRWYGTVNGKKISRARLNMINFLHAVNMPSWLYVHHGEAGTECDEIWNLFPTTNKLHGKIHHPTEFVSRYECEKIRRKRPEVKEAIRNNSLKWYYKNRDVLNDSLEIKKYKKNWYEKNRERILEKMKNRYNVDPDYRNLCIKKAKIQKEKRHAIG